MCKCLVQQKALLAMEGSAINEIPNILKCTLPPHPVYQSLFFDFSRVWFRDITAANIQLYPLLHQRNFSLSAKL